MLIKTEKAATNGARATGLWASGAFSGTRSLASARMVLFDPSESLFAPRDKTLANHYWSALRKARDT